MQISINPATGKTIQEYPEHTPEQTQQIIADVHTCFENFRNTSFAERADHLRAVAEVIEKNQAHYARIMALEMGKPLTEAR